MTSAAQRILVVGGGGREHALCWRIHEDRPDAELFAAPGNAGIGRLATLVPISAGDTDGILAWCAEQQPDLVVVGPDDPLAAGIVDALQGAGVRAFGPTAAAARIEASKAWATDLLVAAGVPIPESHVFESADDADAFVEREPGQWVVKADGLALGKGVIVPNGIAETHVAIDRVARRRDFGAAGSRLLLQERMSGPELSVFAICDGTDFHVIGVARDHKRLEDGDRGPNTGGMGAYSPVAGVGPELVGRIEATILRPTLEAMRDAGCPFVGFLYAGLMLTERGPVVIEFNSRMGDPEAQVVLPLLRFDLVAAMEAAIDGDLADLDLAAPVGAAVCVVLASGGYPGSYERGVEITGLDAAGHPDAIAFHAATIEHFGRIKTAGGRVLGVTGLADTVSEARSRAYARAATINFEGAIGRSDIATTNVHQEVA
jgi:phosphoribosylamine--glycine ligase